MGIAIAEEFLPSDPLFANQWHLRNTGQGGNTSGVDINVTRVWPEFTGSGVAVGVYDTGLEYTHHDLNDNYNASRHVIIDSVVHDPFPTHPGEYHGTAVAGLIGAENNGVGTVGVAFNAQLTGVWIAGRPLPLTVFVQAMSQQDNFDIVNHSWGFTAPFAINQLDPFLAPFFAGISDGANNGRGGLGTIMMKAAGNDRTAVGNSGVARDANDENFTNSRYTNAVAAVNWDGEVSSYSSPGAAILISAPSNTVVANTRVGGIWTADRLGPNGTSSLLSEVSPHADYTGIFGGTSAATPIASGVVALMLEANPDLGWRDVQQILAYSGRHIGSPVGAVPAGNEHDAWGFNGASNWNGGGLHFSNDYGFGLIDALAAVRLAESWPLQSTSANEAIMASSLVTVNQVVPDNNVGGLTFTLGVTEGISIEKVALRLNWGVPHTFVGDLRITITAPAGTVSTLQNRTGGSSNLGDWVFTSNAFRGELSAGTWTVNVADLRALDVGMVSTAQLTVYGSSNTGDDLYVYTNEYSNYAGLFGHSAALTDSDDGTDTINAAAVTSPSIIDLNDGSTSMIDGAPLTLAAGTTIEDAFGGDGDDTMIGNGCDNTLVSNRGSDTVKGGDGHDRIFGGDGHDRIAGGDGNDTLTGGAGGDTLDGGAGIDAASYVGSNAGVIVDLSTGAASGGHAAGDTLTGIEHLIGSSHADTLTGDAGNNSVAGGAGNDMLAGGDRNDTLTGGVGGDALEGGAGVDAASYAGSNTRVNVNLATGAVWGGHATGDTLGGIENLIGSAHADTLIGNSGNNVLNGGLGSDRLAGGDGNDILTGGADNDLLCGGAGIDAASYLGSPGGVTVDLATGAGWDGHATGDTFSGIENLIGSGHADSLTGDAGNNVLNGGLGSDVLTGGAGRDAFVFSAAVGAANVDEITDFSAADDTIRLENAIFTALSSTGLLSAAAFAMGAGAVDPDDRIIYDSAAGALYYDADGTGEVGQVQFATLVSYPSRVAHADFLVV